mmetsp:Transcript_4756/g.9890  ORF Transcript_4756/g.9890 Transcript_4756/m.9890 type:complete len:252 (+) Transcript_4756:148-903(+)
MFMAVMPLRKVLLIFSSSCCLCTCPLAISTWASLRPFLSFSSSLSYLVMISRVTVSSFASCMALSLSFLVSCAALNQSPKLFTSVLFLLHLLASPSILRSAFLSRVYLAQTFTTLAAEIPPPRMSALLTCASAACSCEATFSSVNFSVRALSCARSSVRPSMTACIFRILVVYMVSLSLTTVSCSLSSRSLMSTNLETMVRITGPKASFRVSCMATASSSVTAFSPSLTSPLIVKRLLLPTTSMSSEASES